MAAEQLLPRLNHCFGMNKESKIAFTDNVNHFSTFAWQNYQDLYSDLNLPSSIITVGPDFIYSGIRERFMGGKAESIKVGTVTTDFSKANVTSRINLGEIPDGGTINGYFDFLFEQAELQPAYTLFVADEPEWERIKGSSKVKLVQDDFIIQTYLVGNEVIEIWVFNVLEPVKHQKIGSNGSMTITTAE